MGPDFNITDWVRLRVRQVTDACRGDAWLLADTESGAPHDAPADGQITLTRKTLDFAIGGPGYFLVLAPEGVAGTRLGRFQLRDTGELATSDGWLLDCGFKVPTGARRLVVLRSGEFVAQMPDLTFRALGTLELGVLERDGWRRGLPGSRGLGGLLQGALETISGRDSEISRRRAESAEALSPLTVYRTPAPGSNAISAAGRRHAERRISSQQIETLLRRLGRTEPATESMDPAPTGLQTELMRLAINRLDARQAAELRRKLARESASQA